MLACRVCRVHQEGSDYFNQAAKLKAIFEERYAKLIREDG